MESLLLTYMRLIYAVYVFYACDVSPVRPALFSLQFHSSAGSTVKYQMNAANAATGYMLKNSISKMGGESDVLSSFPGSGVSVLLSFTVAIGL
jgi:hypothetical protein